MAGAPEIAKVQIVEPPPNAIQIFRGFFGPLMAPATTASIIVALWDAQGDLHKATDRPMSAPLHPLGDLAIAIPGGQWHASDQSGEHEGTSCCS